MECVLEEDEDAETISDMSEEESSDEDDVVETAYISQNVDSSTRRYRRKQRNWGTRDFFDI